ncbi:MAG: NifB/NifX family molybdenum-iron cluster-binding protein [Thermoplasmatales archaeon]|nr:NifB/NifX family molybdenum-iron cluster-binding protein [Thermoplasmatales archaeon]
MKIAFPTLGNKGIDEQIGEHFGRVPTYTIFDLESDKIKIIQNISHHMGGMLSPPEILLAEKVKAIICKGLGRKAIEIFERSGIEVYSAGEATTVRDAIYAFKKGLLKKISGSEACDRHLFGHHQK